MKTTPILLLIVTVLGCAVQPVLASRLEIEIRDGDTNVTVFSSMYQNFTRLQDQAIKVTGKDLDAAEQAFGRAIKEKSPGIIISNVAINIITSETWINVTITFKAQNITSKSGQIMKVDCSWKSFDVSDDLASHNITYNMVGRRYVKPTVLSYANNTWARFYLGENRSVYYQEAADVAGNATVLDFSSLSKPLDSWNMTADLGEDETTWFLAPEKVFDLRVTVEDPNGTKEYYSEIELSSEIVVPTFSRIEGDVIVLVQSDFEEPMMFSIVIAVLAVTIGLYIYEKSIKRKQPKTRR